MFERPWVRLLIGALAAALLGAMAARVAVSAGGGVDGAGATSASRGGAGGGSFASGRGSSGGSSGDDAPRGSGATATPSGGSGTVTVHVTGEVRRPGVYRLKEGARVDAAVRRAGGPTRDGDRQALNLAAPVRDGQQVRVPPTAAAAGAAAAAGGGSGNASAAGPATPIDLNTASLEELQTLDGVGPTTAQKIVALREERGGLAGVDDLDEVPGIGAKKLEALRAQLEP